MTKLPRGAHSMSRRDPYRRGISFLVCAAMALVVTAPFTSSVARAGECSRGSSPAPTQTWDSIKAPRFPEGPQEIMSFSLLHQAPQNFAVANGRSIMATADGGCSFTELLSLSSAGFSYLDEGSATIEKVLFSPTVDNVLFASITVEGDELVRPHVIRTTNSGDTWQELDEGLELALGRVLDLAVAPSDPRVAYLLTDTGEVRQDPAAVRVGRGVYALEGDRWENRSRVGSCRPPDPCAVIEGVSDPDRHRPLVNHLEIDPTNAQIVWLYGSDGAYISSDGGESIGQSNDQPITDITFFPTQKATALVAFYGDRPVMAASADGGDNWGGFEAPGVVQSGAHGAGPTEFAMATVDGRVFYQQPGTGSVRPQDISLTGNRRLTQLQTSVSGSTVVIYGTTGTTIERRLAPPIPKSSGKPGRKPPPKDRQIDLDIGGSDIVAGRPSITPDRAKIAMRPGQTRKFTYTLSLPGRRRADVFFLVDSSESMQEEIDGLRAALATIVNELSSSGIDAHFGVGQYRTHNTPPAYERVVDLQPPGDAIEKALESLVAAGGGQNDESHLSALYQVATGDGQDARGSYIAPGQQASWRPGTLRIVVHATDEQFSTAEPNPAFEDVAGALRGVSALQVGLAFVSVDPLSLNNGSPEGDLQNMASQSNAVAPVGGVDCSGDGIPELGPGDPLVCIIDSARSSEAAVMAPAIVNLLKGLRDVADVELSASGPPESGGNVEVTPGRFEGVDLKTPQKVSFAVTYSCPAGITTTYPVTLTATVRGVPTATAKAMVECRKKGAPPFVLPALIAPAALVPPAVQPPEPIPNPHGNSQAQSQSQSQAQQQAQAQSQAAFAPQEQEQPQFAFAYVDTTAANSQMSYAGRSGMDQQSMSLYTGESGEGMPPQAVTALAASLMAAMAAAVTVIRNRTRVQTTRASITPHRNRRRRS